MDLFLSFSESSGTVSVSSIAAIKPGIAARMENLNGSKFIIVTMYRGPRERAISPPVINIDIPVPGLGPLAFPTRNTAGAW